MASLLATRFFGQPFFPWLVDAADSVESGWVVCCLESKHDVTSPMDGTAVCFDVDLRAFAVVEENSTTLKNYTLTELSATQQGNLSNSVTTGYEARCERPRLKAVQKQSSEVLAIVP